MEYKTFGIIISILGMLVCILCVRKDLWDFLKHLFSREEGGKL